MRHYTFLEVQDILLKEGFIDDIKNQRKIRFKYPKNRTNSIAFDNGRINFIVDGGINNIFF